MKCYIHVVIFVINVIILMIIDKWRKFIIIIIINIIIRIITIIIINIIISIISIIISKSLQNKKVDTNKKNAIFM